MTDWMKVPGYEYLEVSDCGQVRSVPRTIVRNRVQGPVSFKMKGKVLKPYWSGGYLCVSVFNGKRSVPVPVHRMMCIAFHGHEPSAGALARHLDDDRSNNKKDNLAWGTPADNGADARRNGKIKSHDSHYAAKLSSTDAETIRSAVASGKPQSSVATAYGVSQSLVSLIASGQRWR